MELLGFMFAAGIWFWLLFIVMSIAIIGAIEIESGVAAFLSILSGIIILWLFSGHITPSFSGTIEWLNQHWLQCIIYVASYALIGVLWSSVKLYFYTHNLADKLKTDYTDQADRDRSWKIQTNLRVLRGRLMCWMTYWPWSLFWTLINDPIKHFYRFAYNKMIIVYQWVIDSAYRSNFK